MCCTPEGFQHLKPLLPGFPRSRFAVLTMTLANGLVSPRQVLQEGAIPSTAFPQACSPTHSNRTCESEEAGAAAMLPYVTEKAASPMTSGLSFYPGLC